MITENVKKLLCELEKTNPYGERVTLVAATKTIDVERINEAIRAGICDIGENKPQEFRDKFELVMNVRYHFFGRLQKNKVKYLIGKAYLIQSVDSVELAEEINAQAAKKNTEENVLIEVNLGEEQKGGCPLSELDKLYAAIAKMQALKCKGLMCVLPSDIEDEQKLKFCLQIREKYDTMRLNDKNISILSMGMTHDYAIAIKGGSNMVRIGEGIFGKRDYNVT